MDEHQKAWFRRRGRLAWLAGCTRDSLKGAHGVETRIARAAYDAAAREEGFENIAQIERLNRSHGGRWFSPENMRFFRCRIHGRVYGGRYFVTSEWDQTNPRRYTVRLANTDGTIQTIGDFCGHDTRGSAHRAAARLGDAS